jgi:hypothetical protein
VAKPSLALVISGSKPEVDDDEQTEHDAAADELADAAGVPEDKRDAFKEALHAYVDLCISEAMKDSKSGDKSDDEEGEY